MNDILQYKGYFASVQFSAEDEVFFGKILGINDLVSFEGTTVKELKDAFKEAIEDYLETCKELEKEPEKMYKGSFNVRIPSELHRQAALVSAGKNMSLNDFVRYAIDLALSKTTNHRTLDAMLLCITLVLPAFMAGFFW
ncbi:MAG TPA: type II toxin-antitoxin system HicB family antitoxin [Sediminibacterium sp.]|jgi:predicted HicB family RNase H-like nuclease